jgi:hypothetical protein
MKGKWLKIAAGSGHFTAAVLKEKRIAPYPTRSELKVKASERRKIHIISLP